MGSIKGVSVDRKIPDLSKIKAGLNDVDINSNTMQFFHSKEAAINGLMLDLYEKRKSAENEQEYMESLFKELSMKYIKAM